MKPNIDDLKASLFSAKDGGTACDAINVLAKLAKKGNEAARSVLAQYVVEGSIRHMKAHACAGLAGAVQMPDAHLAATFRRGLFDPDTRYWSILGYIAAAGTEAYQELIQIAADASIRLEDRAQAIKCLARYSKQKFDRGLPSDPGHWKEEKLRLSELKAWADGGYQDGVSYASPPRHRALDDPRTAFEQIVSRLDKKLAKERKKGQDLAEPTDWLAIAATEDIERVKARWTLPSVYLDFLTRFSPLRVIIKARRFYNPFWLFGAAELIEAQDGYSFNSIEQRSIEDWPRHLVVIASHGGDPYVLDLSSSDGTDAPVYTAEHSAGAWEFERVADSFTAFLGQLTK